MPEMIFISAGFDAHIEDDISGIRLQDQDYEWITGELVAIADQYAGSRIVSTLEGGYEHTPWRVVLRSISGGCWEISEQLQQSAELLLSENCSWGCRYGEFPQPVS